MEVVTVKARRTFAANCYLVPDGQGRCAVIDPGAEPANILAVLRERGWIPAAILLTHGHFDHIGAVKALKKEFPQLKICLHAADMIFVSLNNDAAFHVVYPNLRPHGVKTGVYCFRPDQLVSAGDVLTVGALSFSVLETPGHTAGSVCYACGNNLFTGDTLFYHDLGRTDLYSGSTEALRKSVRQLNGLEKNYIVYPGHDRTTTLDEERDFIRRFLGAAR